MVPALLNLGAYAPKICIICVTAANDSDTEYIKDTSRERGLRTKIALRTASMDVA